MSIRAAGTTHQYVFGLAGVALTVFVLHAARPVILPVALALLVAFVLTPIVTLAQRAGLGRVPAVLVTLVLAGAAAAGIGLMVGTQLSALVRDLPNHQQEIQAKIDRIRGSGGAVSRLADMVHEISQGHPDQPPGEATGEPPAIARVEEGSSLGRALEPVLLVLEPIATASLVLVLMVFVLIGREDLRSRLMATLGRGRLIATVRILDESSRRIGRYLLLQLLMNAAMGTLFAIGLALMGVPYAPLWGVLTTTLRFIPYVGSWISLLLPLTISFATAPDWHQPLMVLGYFAALDLVAANVVEPLLFGHHTGVSPLALLVAAAFWAWVWGPVGLLVSTPLTVCLVVLGQHVPSLQRLAFLLGDQPALPPRLDFYQRVLMEGSEAGAPVVMAAAGTEGAIHAFDEVLIPALAATRADRTAGVLTAAEEEKLSQAVADAIGPALAADTTTTPPSGDLVILGSPAHHPSEELPLRMMAAILKREGNRVEVLTTRLLPADVVNRVAEVGASAVVISILPPGGLPQAAYLCHLLRERYPDLVIVTARWGGKAKYDKLLVHFRRVGASYLTTSLAQTCAQVRATAATPSTGGVLQSVGGAAGGNPLAAVSPLLDSR